MDANEVIFVSIIVFFALIFIQYFYFQIEELIYEADYGGNGKIKYEDFVNMLFMWDN